MRVPSLPMAQDRAGERERRRELRAFLANAREVAAEAGAKVVLRDVALHLHRELGEGGSRSSVAWSRPSAAGSSAGWSRPSAAESRPSAAGCRPVAPRPATSLLAGWDGIAPRPEVAPPPGLRSADLLGVVYQSLVDRDARRRVGAFYTPASLADQLAAATLTGATLTGLDPGHTVKICDPAVGAGSLLLAAARVAAAHAVGPGNLHLTGMDLDPLAASVATTALHLAYPESTICILVGDALQEGAWQGHGRFDAVLANPPFLNQLARRTARSRPDAAELSDRFGAAASGYADTAALFAIVSVELTRPGGATGLILPEPLLTTRDGSAGRISVGARTELRRLWTAPPRTFEAGVRACGVVLRRHGPGCDPGRDTHWRRGEWNEYVADAAGVPDCRIREGGRLGDMAQCTADFRDQFYGVARIATDALDPDRGVLHPALVTSGLIDPLENRWGSRSARIAGRTFEHPRANLGSLDDDHRVRRWAAARLVPKVLVATQTRVLEAIADPHGSLLPVVPVISVIPCEPDRVWHVAAVLVSPPVSALARRRAAGAALSSDAIKLSARQVAGLPLPLSCDRWDAGAAAACAASASSAAGDVAGWRVAMRELADAMCEAYGIESEPVTRWWWSRLQGAGLPVG